MIFTLIRWVISLARTLSAWLVRMMIMMHAIMNIYLICIFNHLFFWPGELWNRSILCKYCGERRHELISHMKNDHRLFASNNLYFSCLTSSCPLFHRPFAMWIVYNVNMPKISLWKRLKWKWSKQQATGYELQWCSLKIYCKMKGGANFWLYYFEFFFVTSTLDK